MYRESGLIHDARFQVVVGLIIVFGIGVASWWGYSSYRYSVNERAMDALALQLDAFDRAKADEAKSASWSEIGNGFGQGYLAHASSDIAPLFLVFESDALIRAQRHDDAMAVLVTAIAKMRSSNPLYYLYSIKLAVMRLGSSQQEIQDQGAAELQALAQDAHNPHKGLALYEIWHQAWVSGNKEVAASAYTKLMMYQQQGAQWGQLAQAHLEGSI